MRLRVLETRLRALFQRIEAAGHGRLGGTPAAGGQGRLVGTPAVAGHGGLGGTPAAAGHGVFGRAPETTGGEGRTAQEDIQSLARTLEAGGIGGLRLDEDDVQPRIGKPRRGRQPYQG